MKKENKDAQIKVRLTTAEAERLKEYAEAHDLTVSEAIRIAIRRLMAIQKEE